MQKIVFMINSLGGGGAERVVTTLLNQFVETYECYLIIFENEFSYELDKRVKIISLYQNKNENNFYKLIKLPILSYKLYKIIKKYKFNQIVSFLYRANYVNILCKPFSKHRVIISERIAPSSMYSNNTLSSMISKFLIKKLYNKACIIISVSKAIKEDLIKNFNIRTKQIVIYNPYDINHIILLSKENIKTPIQKKSIITVGSLSKRKNHQLLIKAFSNIKDKNYKLYIIGEGEEKSNLIKLIKELKITDKVIFLGFDNNPYKYLSKSEIFILSSNSEGFPNALVESMICKCCVISTDCLSGPREILEPDKKFDFQLKNKIELAEYGILTPINDEQKLTEAINTLIEQKSLINMYKEKSIQRVKDFDISKIVIQYKKIICSQ